jgi:hypothetical protein
MGVELRDGTDTVVDVVTGLVFAVGASLAEVVGPPSTPFVVDKSADDPRLNWDGTTATQWRDRTPAQSTPGALNDGLTFASGDQATVMYVRNGPLQTIGEFGFLRYNGTEPWKTISLMNDQARVYDRFTLFTNSVMRGLVNPNTGWTNVLIAVFEEVRADRWPGEVTNQVVRRATDWDGSAPPPDGLSARIAAQVVAQSRAALFTNRSDAAKAIGLAAWNSGVQDVMQVEGFLRNSMGLLDPRQNLFGAFVGVFGVDSDVDVMGPGPGFGNARAFVLFWRDPYLSPDRDGSLVHKSLVRYWQQLE